MAFKLQKWDVAAYLSKITGCVTTHLLCGRNMGAGGHRRFCDHAAPVTPPSDGISHRSDVVYRAGALLTGRLLERQSPAPTEDTAISLIGLPACQRAILMAAP